MGYTQIPVRTSSGRPASSAPQSPGPGWRRGARTRGPSWPGTPAVQAAQVRPSSTGCRPTMWGGCPAQRWEASSLPADRLTAAAGSRSKACWSCELRASSFKWMCSTGPAWGACRIPQAERVIRCSSSSQAASRTGSDKSHASQLLWPRHQRWVLGSLSHTQQPLNLPDMCSQSFNVIAYDPQHNL